MVPTVPVCDFGSLAWTGFFYQTGTLQHLPGKNLGSRWSGAHSFPSMKTSILAKLRSKTLIGSMHSVAFTSGLPKHDHTCIRKFTQQASYRNVP